MSENWEEDVNMDDLHYYECHKGPVIEYGYGPEWVSMMMWMDDYPHFYSKEEALKYWEEVLSKEN